MLVSDRGAITQPEQQLPVEGSSKLLRPIQIMQIFMLLIRAMGLCICMDSNIESRIAI